MIAKAIKGRGFRGALEYDLSKDACGLLATNMDGRSPREFAREFGEIRKLRPSLGKAVLHVSLSAAPGERLTDSQWIEIGQHYLQGMGLHDNQYLITRHQDTEHQHIHLLVNRIRFDGEVVSDSHDYRRQEVLMREIERQHDLKPVQASKEAMRRAPTKGEIERGVRTGLASTRQMLQQLCDGAIAVSRNYSEYAATLAAASVEIIPVLQVNGTRLTGLSYRLDGVTMKGSDLGRGYSPIGLSKRGIRYEKDRDFETVDQQRKQGPAVGSWCSDRGAAPGEGIERRRTGDDIGANRTSDGSAHGRDATDNEHNRSEGGGAGRAHTASDHGGSAGMPNSDATRRERSPANGDGQSISGEPELLPGDSYRLRDGGARERILALAGATERLELPGCESTRGYAGPRDRSLEAVKRQIAAIGAERYVVMLVEPNSGRKQKRKWLPEELLRSVRWLKRMNARGYDVFIAPAGNHAVILIGGLSIREMTALHHGGLNAAVTVQMGIGQCEAWIKIGGLQLADEVRERAVKSLASTLRQKDRRGHLSEFGRLAGFTCHGIGKGLEQRRSYAVVRDAEGAVAKWTSALPDDRKKSRQILPIHHAGSHPNKSRLVKKHKTASHL